tara:strand:- start:53 stop:241 length:189 start_codon:yes stop_codon:yes gene_type:complete
MGRIAHTSSLMKRILVYYEFTSNTLRLSDARNEKKYFISAQKTDMLQFSRGVTFVLQVEMKL